MNLYHKSILYGPEQEGTNGGSGKPIPPDQTLPAQEVSTPDTRVEMSEPISITEDPEYQRIKEELNAKWLSDRGEESQSARHQDYLYGSFTDKSATTLEQDAERAFREQFPELAQKYDKNERVRVYDRIGDDPAYQELNKRAINRTNRDKEVNSALESGSQFTYRDTWARGHGSEMLKGLSDFVKQYPEKAQSYADRWTIYVNENPTTAEMSNEEWHAWCEEYPNAVPISEYRSVAKILKYVQEKQGNQTQSDFSEGVASPENEDLPPISSEDLLAKALQEFEKQEGEANTLPFEIDPETGLSLEGQTVQEIQDRLAQLENREAKYIEDLVNTETRIIQQGELESALGTAKTNRDNLLQQIQQFWNTFKAQNPDTKKTKEDFLAIQIPGTETTPQGMVNAEEEKVNAAHKALTEFEVETQRLINKAYETELQATRDRLEALNPEYVGQPAEKHDKQVVLEQKFTSIDSFRTDRDMREFFEHYGYQEGRRRFEELKGQSDTELYSDSLVMQNYNEAAREQHERENNNLNQELRTQEYELSSIQEDETYKQLEELDRSRDLYKFQLNWMQGELKKIDFAIELTQDGFQVLGEKEAQDAIDSLDKERETIQEENEKLLRDNGYKDENSVQSDLDQETGKGRFNPTKDKAKISRLAILIATLKTNHTKEEEKSSEIKQMSDDLNTKRSRLRTGDDSKPGVGEIYEKLVPYTQNILQNVGDKSVSDLMSVIDKSMQELQNYTTPDELIAKRDRIAELKEEIKTLKSKQEDLRR